MRNYQILHSGKQYSNLKGTVLLLLFYISVTVRSSNMSITYTIKWMWNSTAVDNSQCK